MAYDYDALYKTTPDALGDPTQVFVTFFEDLPDAPLRVLDIGCGQGRDALFIARLGHHVTGVDLSPHGIQDLTTAAKAEGLNITGVTADITSYTPDALFDVILIDRTLHMLPDQQRDTVLAHLIRSTTPDGWVLIADEKSNMPGFKRVFADDSRTWTPTLDTNSTLFMRNMA